MTTSSERLTTDGRLKSDPVFIKNGEEIVYALQETPTLMSLMRLKLADRSVERFFPQATTNEFEPGVSADGRYCAFVQSRGNLSLKLVIRDLKENRDSVFDPGGGFAGMRHPSIAPDNSRVIFSIAANNGQQIQSVNIKGEDRRSITSSSINHWPSYSPDGKRIVFGSSRDGRFEIYVMSADGNDVKRLTHGPGMNMRPAWSPDGKQIAFVSNRDAQYEIYLMNADGTGTRRLTNHPERDDYPAWHPDGKRLVEVAERDGKFDLYLIDVEQKEAGQ